MLYTQLPAEHLLAILYIFQHTKQTLDFSQGLVIEQDQSYG